MTFIKQLYSKKQKGGNTIIRILGIKYKIKKQSISIGEHSYVGSDLVCGNVKTKIGKFCSIAPHVAIGPGQHPTDWLSLAPFQYDQKHQLTKDQKLCSWSVNPCTIGNDVWIGRDVVIQDGITIGDGAVVGSNAVVTKNVPPYAIVGGVPAKIIRYRFQPETIQKLLKLKWWDLPDEVIATLPFKDIEASIKELEKIREKIK